MAEPIAKINLKNAVKGTRLYRYIRQEPRIFNIYFDSASQFWWNLVIFC